MSDPLAVARDLQPRIRAVASEIEEGRRLPQKLVYELVEAGLFHLMIPRSLGGEEVDPITAARVVEELAYADGSTGWCVMLAHQSVIFAGILPPPHAREIWGNGGIVAGTARPIGRAVATNDPEPGYMVSGRWPFASGSSHATWFMAECIVYDGDAPRKDAQGNNVTRALFVPREAVTIHDTWDSLGLRGTASHDFSLEPVFVPAGRGFQMLVDPPVDPWPVYQVLPLVFMNHGSHALGIARAALDTGREIIGSRKGWGDVPLKDQPRFQTVVAEATALVESARAYLYDTAEELWRVAQSGAEMPAPLRARARLSASHAARASVQAVDLLHGAVATSGVFRSSPLERQFRDIHTAIAHVMIGPLVMQAAGRVELGLGPEFPFF
jgi:indole-3-acetate monooxygenase